MKRFFYTFWFLLASHLGSAQKQVSIAVIDSFSRNGVSYASVKNLRSGQGILTMETGSFKMIAEAGDNLEISCVGYHSVVYSIRENAMVDSIILMPLVKSLPEVIVKEIEWESLKSRRIGIPSGKSNWHVGGKVGMEYSTLVKNPGLNEAYIQQLHYKLRKPTFDTVVIRLHLYEVDKNGMPGAELLDNDAELITGTIDNLVSFDVSSMKILFPKTGVYVGIEWLGRYSADSNAVINSRATFPSLGFNEKSEAGLTLERENGAIWTTSDVRKFYLNSSIEKRAFSKDAPQATIGLTVKYKK